MINRDSKNVIERNKYLERIKQLVPQVELRIKFLREEYKLLKTNNAPPDELETTELAGKMENKFLSWLKKELENYDIYQQKFPNYSEYKTNDITDEEVEGLF